MKPTTYIKLSALVLIALARPGISIGQEYYVTTPISGYMSMSVLDFNGPAGSHYDPRGSAGASDGIEFNFNTLTEHIYINKTTGTIRQVGIISGTPSDSHMVINDSHGSTSGALTVQLAPSGGSVVTFDTGLRPMTWYSGQNTYTFNGDISNIGSFNGSYSLVTGGQTYTGSFSYTSAAYSGLAAYTFTTFSPVGLNSITLNGLGDGGGAVRYGATPSTVADVTAANGFHMLLGAGAGEGYGVYGDVINWSSGPVVATIVPEPSSCQLLLFALPAVAFFRRRK